MIYRTHIQQHKPREGQRPWCWHAIVTTGAVFFPAVMADPGDPSGPVFSAYFSGKVRRGCDSDSAWLCCGCRGSTALVLTYFSSNSSQDPCSVRSRTDLTQGHQELRERGMRREKAWCGGQSTGSWFLICHQLSVWLWGHLFFLWASVSQCVQDEHRTQSGMTITQ